MPKALFLYTELAGYIVNCLEELSNSGVEVHCVRYAVNAEAPFKFSADSRVKYYERNEYSSTTLQELAKTINPDIILCSGWIDNDYLSLCHKFAKRIPTVLVLDNQWTATLKQKLATVAARFLLKSRFRYCWVPGKPQRIYAEKLGFKPGEIEEGFYAADVHHFKNLGAKYAEVKRSNFPHRFLYVGRYVDFKGLPELWRAFSEIDSGDWELWCLGTGKLFETKFEHPKIKHFGFVQPADLDNFVRDTGVFVLPSHKEPWGVVLHEFAAAAYPVICSDTVGAASAFLKEGQNGFINTAGDVQSLKNSLLKCIQCSDDELREMGEISAGLASQITPQRWVSTLKRWLKENEKS